MTSQYDSWLLAQADEYMMEEDISEDDLDEYDPPEKYYCEYCGTFAGKNRYCPRCGKCMAGM